MTPDEQAFWDAVFLEAMRSWAALRNQHGTIMLSAEAAANGALRARRAAQIISAAA